MLLGANDHPNTSSRLAQPGSMTQSIKDSQDEKKMPAHGQWVHSAYPFLGTTAEGPFEPSEGRRRSAIQAAYVPEQIIPEPVQGPDGQMAPTDQDLDTDTVINTVIYRLENLTNASAPSAAEDHVRGAQPDGANNGRAGQRDFWHQAPGNTPSKHALCLTDERTNAPGWTQDDHLRG
ncbi:hypothetical protein RB213_012724 [Colletotrichum asianum]